MPWACQAALHLKQLHLPQVLRHCLPLQSQLHLAPAAPASQLHPSSPAVRGQALHQFSGSRQLSPLPLALAPSALHPADPGAFEQSPHQQRHPLCPLPLAPWQLRKMLPPSAGSSYGAAPYQHCTEQPQHALWPSQRPLQRCPRQHSLAQHEPWLLQAMSAWREGCQPTNLGWLCQLEVMLAVQGQPPVAELVKQACHSAELELPRHCCFLHPPHREPPVAPARDPMVYP
mmetsp:Transcript_28624/g.66328  ORF Transcript_28624/g.66328 Transcript_28624/m.66328 type:complete len:230 (+) Transcript_28624:859-1548(+)